MVYIYKDDKDRIIVSTSSIPDLPLILIFPWDFLPVENIRPWKILGISTDLYKPGILEYLEKWKDSDTPPPKETLAYIYRDGANKIFHEYKKILDLLCSLELIEKSDELSFKRFIVYECDIENYMRDVLGNYTVDLLDKYCGLSQNKKDILITFSKINNRENKFEYLKNQEIDLDLFTFLPPWFKASYQIFGQQERIVRNQNIGNIEYNGQDRIDGFIGESLIGENIYNVFHSGEILSAKEIKERLAALYQHLGLNRLSRVSDLDNYFEVMRTYSRLYRLDRKR